MMRSIEPTTQFRRDVRRLRKGRYARLFPEAFDAVVEALALDRPLPTRLRDHGLIGDWADHRDCHLAPDLVLIYRKVDAGRLLLVRLGSHSELQIG